MKMFRLLLAMLVTAILSPGCSDHKTAVLTIDLGREGAEISPELWGIFYEEISRAGEGGLYPEMIYNRAFEEKNIPATMTFKYGILFAPPLPSYAYNQVRNWGTSFNANDKAEGWSLETNAGSQAAMTVVTDQPCLDPATPHSLLVDIKRNDGRVTLWNEGFRGMALKSGEKYDLLFHVRAPGTYKGKIIASLVGSNGSVIAKNEVNVVNDGKWNSYPFTFASGVTDNKVRLSIQFTGEGKLWLDYFSLLPRTTFMNHGLRQDIAQTLADLKPGFIRWPGGCVVEGCTMENRIKWWESVGPRISRGGTYDMWGSKWG
jgi:hypothetical protein